MKKQQGFTLIELMIASLISIFLITGIMNLFITTNKTVSLSDALSQNQETGRFAMDYLTRFLRNAGYTQNATLSPPELMIKNSNPDFEFLCSVGSADYDACAVNNPDSDTIRGDRLSIVYVASATEIGRTSCTGSDVGGAIGEQKLADVFWVSNEAGSQRELRCRTYDIDNNNWLAGTVSIINNVESFEYQVGLASSDTSKNVSRYTSMDNIDEALNKRIRSIRVAILTTSINDLDVDHVKTSIRTRKYGVLDADQEVGTDKPLEFNDGNLRSLFITTIELPSSIESAMHN